MPILGSINILPPLTSIYTHKIKIKNKTLRIWRMSLAQETTDWATGREITIRTHQGAGQRTAWLWGVLIMCTGLHHGTEACIPRLKKPVTHKYKKGKEDTQVYENTLWGTKRRKGPYFPRAFNIPTATLIMILGKWLLTRGKNTHSRVSKMFQQVNC